MSPPPPPDGYQPPARPTHVAWRKREGGRWQRVGEGTEEQAWAAIWRAIKVAPPCGAFSSCVIREGEKP